MPPPLILDIIVTPLILIIAFSHSTSALLHLSVHLFSSFPSHAVSFSLTDMDCDLHR
jgi:hypothetical protein